MKKTILLLIVLATQLSNSQKLTETQKLATACKVWGFLKYYHPNLASGKFNWDEELLEVLPQIENANTKEQFSKVLENWIDVLGEVKKTAPIKDNDTTEYFYKNLDLAWISKNALFSKKVSEKLEFIKDNRVQKNQHYVTFDKEGTKNALFQNEVKYSNFIWSDKNLRILSLFRYWNFIEYFYPYKYLMDQKWNKSLIEILPTIINCKNENEYDLSLLKLVTSLNDTHADFYWNLKKYKLGKNYIPANFKFIDNKMIITKILNDSVAKKNDLKLGDAIISVDKKLISEVIKENRKVINASNEASYLRNLALKYRRFSNNKIEIEYVRNTKKTTKTIELYNQNDFFNDLDKKNETSHFKIIENNVGYVDMKLLDEKEVQQMILNLKTTSTIIFDVRNYPNDVEQEISLFLNSQKKCFAKTTYPDLSYPGRFIFQNEYCGAINNDNYKGKVILLVNEFSQSFSEWLVMCLKTAPNVTVIGSQTAGADGDVSEIDFIGDYNTSITGLGVYYPDGRQTQRIGIIPDIEVKPTIEGIKQGKDEVFERAIKFIETGK